MKVKCVKAKNSRFTAIVPFLFVQLFSNYKGKKILQVGVEFWHSTYFAEVSK